MITEGALLLSLFIVLLLSTLYIPVIGIISLWALPIPFILYTVLRGVKAGLFLFTGAVILTFAIGQLLALPITMIFAISGIVIGTLIRKKKPAFAVLLGGSLSYITMLLMYYVLSILIFDFNIIESTKDMMLMSLKTAEDMLGQSDDTYLNMMYSAIELIEYVIPSALIFTGILAAFLTQVFATPIVKRFYNEVPQWKPFREWNFPKSFIWYYVIILIITLTVQLEVGTLVYIIVVNLQIMLEFIMLIQGFTFIYFLFHIKKWNKGLLYGLTIITILMFPLLSITRILGIIDLGFDLKSKLKNK
jgi:uncharacterized protein YybS (DUF2232 family)